MVKKKPKPSKDYTEDAIGIGLDAFSDDPIRNLVNRYSPIPTMESPKGLVPIGDSGLYATPEEPADPMDCDRYPNSIYCGGNPFSLTAVGLEPSIIIDGCNIGIQLEITLGFIKLPPLSIVYRRPECREDKRELEKPKLPDADNYNETPNYRRINCSRGSAGTMLLHEEQYTDYYSFAESNIYAIYKVLYRSTTYTKVTNEILEVNHPYKIRYLHNKDNNLVYLHMKIKITIEQSNNRPVEGFTKTPFENQTALMFPGSSSKSSRIEERWLHKYDKGGHPGRTTTSLTHIGVHNYGNLHADIERGIRHIETCRDMQFSGYAPSKDDFNRDLVYKGISYYDTYYFRQTNQVLQFCDHPVLIIPPPPPIIRKKKLMECCPEHTLLLLALIKKVDKLSKIIGVDDYPVSLPTSLISKDEGFLGNLIPNANQDVPSLTRFLSWYIERFDEIMGQWEIPIEIKDSDPSKPGDQPLGVKLPNMAEAIAEMFTLAFQTNLNSETLLNFAVRTAAEGVADKQQNFITYKLVQSMAEWAGYKQKDIKLKMPILFSLGKTRYDEILNESEIDVPCTDFDEKFGLEADLMRFREAAGILQAVYKKKVDPSGDIKGQILKHLLDAFAAVNKVNGEDEDKDFKKFLTEVEDGFIKEPGANNTTEPYGRPYKERPKIRDLTNNKPPTNP